MHGKVPLIIHFFVSCLASSPIETTAFAYRVAPSSQNLQLSQGAALGAPTAQTAQAVTQVISRAQQAEQTQDTQKNNPILQTVDKVSQQTPVVVQQTAETPPALAKQTVTQPLGSAANVAAEAANVATSAAVNANVAATNAAKAAASLGKSSIEASTVQNVAIAAKKAADAANEAAVAASTAASQAAMANAVANQVSTPVQASDGVRASQASMISPSQQQEIVPIAAATMAPAAPVVTTVKEVPESTYSTSQWYFSQAMQLIYGLTFAMIVKGLCVAGNVLVQVSPISQIKRWEARSCTGEADAAPYVSIAFGGCQWCFYGLFAWIVTARSGFLILVQSNCLGALLGSYYVVTFYRNCRNDGSLSTLQRYLSGVTSLALLQVCALSVLPAERALFLTGLISSFCSFIGATSVLVTVPQVIRKKDSRSIPGPYALANFLSSAVWSLCGYILDDPMVMIPNIFSTCCATLSLGLKVLYPSDGDEDEADKNTEEGISKEMKDRQLQINVKGVSKVPSEITPMLPMKSRKDAPSIPEKLADIARKLPDHMPICGGVAECGTGGTF